VTVGWDTRSNVATGSVASAWLIAAIAVACLSFWPASGLGLSSLADWNDQIIFLRALTQTLEQGLPDAETRTLVGPAYVGLGVVTHWFSGPDLAQALVLLSRLTFAACATILATIATASRARAGIGLQLALAAVVVLSLGTSVWFRFSDIPWTHFVAAAFLGAILLVSLSRLPLALRAFLIAALGVALLQTRLFEALVALVAAGLILPVALVRHRHALLRRPTAALWQLALPALVGGAAAFLLVGVLSHNWALYEQYRNQTGVVLSPELAPLKAIQLFWDTCFATLCSLTAAPRVSPWINSLDSWQQPLLLQLPGLIAAGTALLTLVLLRPREALRLPLGVLFATLTAGGIVLAYVSGAPSGSPHLKYGFFRDFVPPLVLLTGAFIGAVATQRAADGRTHIGLVLSLGVYFVVVVGLTALRPVGLPSLPGTHVERFELTSSCAAGDCRFALAAIGPSGTAMPYSDLAYVTCSADPLFSPIRRVSELRGERSRLSAGGHRAPRQRPALHPRLVTPSRRPRSTSACRPTGSPSP
jgi:hypothetical protein